MDGYLFAANFTSLPIQGFSSLDGYIVSQPKYPIGIPCEDCGGFCKQQCFTWDNFETEYPGSLLILDPDEYSRRATKLLIESKVRYR